MSQINYYTEEGLKKLKDELHEMKTVQRPSISNQIAEARDKGDLSENAEYDAAKEAQGLADKQKRKKQLLKTSTNIKSPQMVRPLFIYRTENPELFLQTKKTAREIQSPFPD